MHPRHRLATIATTTLLLATLLPAQTTYTWTGSIDGLWSTSSNWDVGTPASATDTALIFDNTTQLDTVVDISGGLTLTALAVGSSSGARTFSGNALTFAGAAPTLSLLTSATGGVAIANNLVLDADLTITGAPTVDSQSHLTGNISGSSGLTFASGFTTLNGTGGYTGATLIQSGAIVGVSSTAMSSTSGITVADGGELQLLGATVDRALTHSGILSASVSSTYSGDITLAEAATIHAFDDSTLTLSGAIDRAGHTLTLSTGGSGNGISASSASFTGNGDLRLQPAGGTLVLGAISGDGNVTLSGSGGTTTFTTLAGDGTLAIGYDSVSSVAEFAGVISGARDIAATGGILILDSASSTFTGTVTISSNGTLEVANESRLGDAANNIVFSDGGTLALTASGNLTRGISITSGTGTFVMTTGSHTVIGTPTSGSIGISRTISSDISGAGGLALRDFSFTGAIATLTGNNTFSGGLTIGSGVIATFNTESNLGTVGGSVTLDGGSLSLPNGLGTFSRPLAITSSDGSISANNGQSFTLSGDITGEGQLTLGGGASYTLTGNNTFSGGLVVAGNVGLPATLVVDSTARLGDASGSLTLGKLNGASVLPATLKAAGSFSIGAGHTTTFRNLTVDTGGFDVTFDQAMSGRGLTKTGSGTLTLNTADTDTSGTNIVQITGGTLRIGIDDALGTKASLTNLSGGATLDLDDHDLTLLGIGAFGPSTIALGSGTLTVGGGTIESDITGTGSVVLTGGTTTLSGNNTFTGGLSAGGGATLQLDSATALGSLGSVTLDNATLSVSSLAGAPVVIDGSTNLTIASGGATFNASGQSIVIANQLTGAEPLTFKGGSGPGDSSTYEVRLTHTANTFVGNIQLGRASDSLDDTLGITADGSLGDAANAVTLGDRFFDGESTRTARGGLRAYADLTLSASRVIQINGSSDDSDSGGLIDTQAHTVTVAGSISELSSGVGLRKVGSGTLLLDGSNTYTGVTLVDEGTLGGHGTVASLAFSSGTTFAPGASAGLFTATGDVQFTADVTLAIELGGTARGTGYDAVDVGGSVELNDATLEVTLIGGFSGSVQQSDIFTVLASSSLTGVFFNIANGERIATSDGLGSFVVNYGDTSAFDSNSVVLSGYLATVPEPATWAALAGAVALAFALVGGRRRRR